MSENIHKRVKISGGVGPDSDAAPLNSSQEARSDVKIIQVQQYLRPGRPDLMGNLQLLSKGQHLVATESQQKRAAQISPSSLATGFGVR